ncbi:MAG: M42 family peptidase [Ruminococcus sp.]|jgi:endoglucanase|nr:M42 family peptidase [Ruminococcus sp.]
MLKNLCDLCGGSGDEERVRRYIIEQIKDYCDYTIDNIGNITAHKKGKNAGKKIIFTAHMDEVSFIITSVSDSGFSIAPVGGIDAAAAIGRRIVNADGLVGVIGARATHNLTESERETPLKFENLFADFGFSDKKSAEKFLRAGDRVYFAPNFSDFGGGKIKSKAIDDRFGCYALIKMIQSDLPFDSSFAFLVQEEVGCRGAKALKTDADYAVVIETTTAADFEGITGDKRCCLLGEGAVVGFMDRSAVYDKALFELSRAAALDKNIKWQTKTLIAGGNDSSQLNTKPGGIKTIAVSLPCRYLHTGASVADKADMAAVEMLAFEMLNAINTEI